MKPKTTCSCLADVAVGCTFTKNAVEWHMKVDRLVVFNAVEEEGDSLSLLTGTGMPSAPVVDDALGVSWHCSGWFFGSSCVDCKKNQGK